VVVSGVAEARIERDGTQPIRLRSFESGDFFGEMSLFDGQVRSASVIALNDCQLLLVARAPLMTQLMPRIATSLLSELAKRVRQTDLTLTQLSDDMSRAAFVNGHAAVAVELDAIKTLYRRTEVIANDTLERAERRASEVMARADAVSAGVKRDVTRTWELVKRRAAPLLFVSTVVLGWFGFNSVAAVRAKLAEVETQSKKMRGLVAGGETALADSSKIEARLQNTYQRMRALEETVGELRAVRDAVGFEQPSDTPERLKRAALNYESAKAEIRTRYFGTGDDVPHCENCAPEVIFEAVDTYVTLVMAGGDDTTLRVTAAERGELLRALAYVVQNSIDADDGDEPLHAARLFDKRMRDMLAFVAQGADSALRKQLERELNEALEAASGNRARDNLALGLASLGAHTPGVLRQLTDMLASTRPWREGSAALGLVQLADPAGFAFLQTTLVQDSGAAYPTALLLAESGGPQLAALSDNVAGKAQLAGMVGAVERVLLAHRPHNCLEERYALYRIACLHGDCRALPADAPGAQCPNYSNSLR
jgi:CRP-like cAMP-binding protein